MNKYHGFPSNHIMCRHPVENYCKHPPSSHDWDMYYEATEHKNIMLVTAVNDLVMNTTAIPKSYFSTIK